MTQTESILAWAMEMARGIRVLMAPALSVEETGRDIDRIAKALVAAEARGMERAAEVVNRLQPPEYSDAEKRYWLGAAWDAAEAAIRTAKDQPS